MPEMRDARDKRCQGCRLLIQVSRLRSSNEGSSLLNWGNLQACTYLSTTGWSHWYVGEYNYPYLDGTRLQKYGLLLSDDDGCSHVADCARSADNQQPMIRALSVDLTQSTR